MSSHVCAVSTQQ